MKKPERKTSFGFSGRPLQWKTANPAAWGERVHYNKFYARDGWRYNTVYERWFLKRRIVDPLGLQAGARVLEIGCGMGLHSALLHDLGYEVIGVDVSEVGICIAAKRYPGPHYMLADLSQLEFEPDTFDVVFSRGMSWYHYELHGLNVDGVDVPARTKELFGYLRPQGVFILQISTDFSGTGRGPGNVHYNRLADYIALFERFGRIELLTNWYGEKLKNQASAERIGGNILIATRKLSKV